MKNKENYLETVILDRSYSISEAARILGLKRTALYGAHDWSLINFIKKDGEKGMVIEGREIIRYSKTPDKKEHSFEEALNAVPELTEEELNREIENKETSKIVFAKNGKLSGRFVGRLYAKKTMAEEINKKENGYYDIFERLGNLIDEVPQESVPDVLRAFKLPFYLIKNGNYNINALSAENLEKIIERYRLKNYRRHVNELYSIGVGLVEDLILNTALLNMDKREIPKKIDSIIVCLDQLIYSDKNTNGDVLLKLRQVVG